MPTRNINNNLNVVGDGAEIFLKSADHNIARIIPRGTGSNLDKGLLSLFDTGTEDVRIDTAGNSWFNGGNVGIGQGSPTAKLHLKGDGGTSGLTFKTTDFSNNEIFYVMDGGRVGVRYWPFSIGIPSTSSLATNAVFQVEEAGLLTVLTTGNVGIGTTSPAVRLDFGSATGKAFHLYTSGTDAYGFNMAGVDSGTFSTNIFSGSGGQIKLRTGTGTPSTRLTVTNAGNVGIGTTSPTSKLHVSLPNQALGFNSSIFASANPSDYTVGRGSGITFQNADSYTGGVYGIREANNWTGALAFYTHTSSANNVFDSTFTEKMRITSSGNVGIGTTGPATKLHVVGRARFDDTQINAKGVYADYFSSGQSLTLNSGASASILFKIGNTTALTLDSSENATFAGYTSTPNSYAQNFYVTSSGTNITNRIDNDGTQLYITYSGTSNRALEIKNSNGDATFAGNVNIAQANNLTAGSVITTSSTALTAVDNGKAIFGTGLDLQIFHDGSHSYISDAGTGDLRIQGSNNIVFYSYLTSEVMANMINNGGVELYFDNSKKFATTTDGIQLYGNGYLDMPDNGRIRMGASYDLAIYHDGSHSYIDEVGTGDLRIRSNSATALLSSTNENMLVAIANGAVELYFDNSKKLQTTSTGVSITGGATLSGNVGIGTTSPSAKLDVSVTSGAAWMSLINGSETAFRLTTYNNGTSNGSNAYAFKHGLYYNTTENAAVTFYRGGGSTGGFLTFTTNAGSERMRITSAGNVGIGTTNPNDQDLSINAPKLHVVGPSTTGAFNLVARFQGGNDNDNTGAAILINHSNDRGLLINAGRANSDREVAYFNLVSSGAVVTNVLTLKKVGSYHNAGIGVEDPDAKLEIKGSSSGTSAYSLRVRNSSNTEFFSVRDDGVTTVTNNYFYVHASQGAYVQHALRVRGSLSNDVGVLSITGDVNFDSNTMFVDSTNNRVGIGTASPSSKLEVVNSSGNTITLKKGTGTPALALAGTSDQASALIEGIAGGGLKIYTSNGGTLSSPSWGERMVIDGSGNVTINAGNLFLANSSSRISNGANGEIGFNYNTGATGGLAWYGGGTSSTFSVTNSGNLSLSGHISVSQPKTISFANAQTIRDNGGGGLAIRVPIYRLDLIAGTDAGNGHITFQTNNGTERMRVSNGGNVGIGTTNPAYKLDVAGSARIEGDLDLGAGFKIANYGGSYWQRIRTEDAVASTTNAFNFETRNGSGSFIEHMVIRNDGNVGIGVTNPSYKLQVGGSIVGTSKNFIIDHPTKEGKKLLHGCIEGPEAAVYFRGKSTSNIIEMPDYWIGLVDIDTMTVDITPWGPNQDIYVESIADDGEITIAANTEEPLNYFYVVYGERKDIDKLEIEVIDPKYANENSD
jgi:lipopolysaccharide export system protein LptA